MQVAVFHPGTQHSWQTACALQQLGRLEWYATSIFHQPDRYPYRLVRYLPARLASALDAEFARFHHPGIDPQRVRTGGLSEWLERAATRAGWRGIAQRLDRFGNRRFAEVIGASIRSPAPFALWGYNGSALAGFEQARKQGRTCILDRTIGDYRAYNRQMDALQDRYGAWFLPGERCVSDTQIRDDDREYALSDVILAGSEPAAATIRTHAPDQAHKVRLLPYCFDEQLFAGQPTPRPLTKDGPVKFLFVGQVSPRKGIHHLLEAFAAIPESAASLTIVGDLRIPRPMFARFADRVTYLPQVPRRAIPQIMADHHVLVFPSYFEGSALTLLEALASGLGIVQTRSSGNGATPACGIVLDRPDSDALREAILASIEDRTQIDAWRLAAQVESRRYSFTNYRANIAALLDGLA